MSECSFCKNQAVMISGRNYCVEHLGAFETIFFEAAVKNLFKSADEMGKFFMWAFGSENPKLSDLRKWHGRIERKERANQENWRGHGIYEESQDYYIQRIGKEYLKEDNK